MMKSLSKKLSSREINFDADDRRIMCFGHIVDLATKRVVQKVDANPKVKRKGADDEDEDEDDFSLVDNVDRSKPISVARSAVRVIRASGMRREAFNDVIKDGNERHWFKEGTKIVKLPELQLLRDVQTRWDSVYKMLKRLRVMRLVSYDFR
jgi:hypothetical protein